MIKERKPLDGAKIAMISQEIGGQPVETIWVSLPHKHIEEARSYLHGRGWSVRPISKLDHYDTNRTLILADRPIELTDRL